MKKHLHLGSVGILLVILAIMLAIFSVISIGGLTFYILLSIGLVLGTVYDIKNDDYESLAFLVFSILASFLLF